MFRGAAKAAAGIGRGIVLGPAEGNVDAVPADALGLEALFPLIDLFDVITAGPVK